MDSELDSPLPFISVNKGNWVARKGYDFHLTLLIRFLLRAAKTGNEHLRFSAEVEGVGAWDDILVEDNNQGKKWTLFQAKHHEKTDGHEKKISYQALIATKGDYSLPKYFLSFLEAKTVAEHNEAQIENVVICTTSDFEGKKDRFGTVTVKKSRDVKILFTVIPNGEMQLWRELLSMQSDIGVSFYFIKEKELLPILNVNEVKNEIMKRKLLHQDTHLEEFGLNREDFEKKVSEFSQKLIFCIQIPKLETFTEDVKREFKENISPDNIETFYSIFFARFQRWVVETLPKPIEVKSYQELVEDVAMENQLTELYLHSKKRHKASQIQFKDVSALIDFICSEKNWFKIMFWNSKLSIYQLCQAMEEQHLRYMEIPFSQLITTYNDVLKYLQAKTTEFEFVIDCNNDAEVAELLILKSKTNIFLSFPSSTKLSILQKSEFQSKSQIYHSDVEISFSEFTPESQDFILQKKVKFQGKDIRVGDLLSAASVSYDVLTEPFLEQLLLRVEQIEVGVPLPDIQETEPHYIPRKLLTKLPDEKRDQWDEKTPIDLKDCRSQCMVLSADPGMGKSTFLQHAAHELKQLYPRHLVIYINLADHTKLLDDMNTPNANNITRFLQSAMNLKENLMLNSIFIPWIKTARDKTIIILDSFDEISPTFSEKVIHLIEYLQFLHPFRLWVATRYHTQAQLEQTLGTSVFTLREFTREDQITFLKLYWQKITHLKNTPFPVKKFNAFTKNLFQLLKTAISDGHVEFMGIPLQTRMIAEAFSDSFKSWINQNETLSEFLSSVFPSHYNIFMLYDEFINKKFNIFIQEKCKRNDTVVMEKVQKVKEKDHFLKSATELALWTIFKYDDIRTILNFARKVDIFKQTGSKPNSFRKWLTVGLDSMKIKSKLENRLPNVEVLVRSDGDDETSQAFLGRDGVVIVSSSGERRFLHRTFAEFLAGKYLGNLIKQNNMNTLSKSIEKLIIEIQDKSQYYVVRMFMEYAISLDLPLHCAVLGDNITATRKLMHQHSHDKDSLKRSALQLAIYWKRQYIIHLLLTIPQPVEVFDRLSHSPITQTLLSIQKNEYGSVQYSHLYLMVKYKSGFPSHAVDFSSWTNNSDEENVQNLLKKTARDLVASLENHLNKNQRKKLQPLEVRLLKYFAGGCLGDLILNTQPIPTLLNTFAYNFTRNKNWDNEDVAVFDCVVCWDLPLHQAIIDYDYAACRHLLSQGENVNRVDVLNRSALHLATAYYYDYSSKLIKKLCEFGACLDACNVFGETPIVLAANEKNWYCVAVLLTWGASPQPLDKLANIDWDQLLYEAAGYGYERVVALCLTKQLNLNQQDAFGQTPLHLAALFGRVFCVEMLLNAGAQISITNEDGKTPEQEMMRNNSASGDEKQQIQDLLHQYQQNNP